MAELNKVKELLEKCQDLTEEHIIQACQKHHDELTTNYIGETYYIKYNDELYKLNPTIRYANNEFLNNNYELFANNNNLTSKQKKQVYTTYNYSDFFKQHFSNCKLINLYIKNPQLEEIYKYIEEHEKEILNKLEEPYLTFLKEDLGHKITDNTYWTDTIHARGRFKSYFEDKGIYFWRILENDTNIQKYKEVLNEKYNGEQRYYSDRIDDFKKFFDTKYGGYFNWLKTFEKYCDDNVTYWRISGNSKFFNHKKAFDDNGYIDWSQGQNKFKVGDIVYVYSSKPDQKIRYKTIITDINLNYQDVEDDKEYWFNLEKYQEKLKNNEKVFRIKLLQEVNDDRVSIKTLINEGFIEKPSDMQGRSYIKDKKFINYLNAIFDNKKEDEEIIMTKTPIKPSLNMILYGPPGTGKTYNTKEYVNEIIKNNKIKDNNFIDISDLNWYSAIALGMYKKDENGHFSVPELKTIPEIQMFYESMNNKNFNNALWLYLQTHTSRESKNVKYNLEKRRKPYLFDKDENSKWYLTENGKEYIKDNLSEYLDNSEDNTKNNKFVEFITFHQSYSYEEFIEGIRPKMSNNDEEKQTLSYEYNIGIFKDMCLRANSDPDNKYVIVIDEINRGNISKIFGELITLIEKDKRITPNGEYGFENIETKNTELLIRLPYTQRFFGVPNNLYIIGTMNTADKSLALLDVALRRRFKFIPMYPQYDKTNDGNIIYHSEFLKELNKQIFKKKKNADYLIGHSYFMSEEDEPELKDILNNNVIPLLMEYFNGKIEEVKKLLEDVDNSLTFDSQYSFDSNELYYLQVK